MSILAVAMTAAFQIATSGLALTVRGNQQRALMLQARSVLDRVWARDPREAGTFEGELGGGKTWRVHIEPYEAAWATATHDSRAAIYDIQVDVLPARGAPFTLRTLRLNQ